MFLLRTLLVFPFLNLVPNVGEDQTVRTDRCYSGQSELLKKNVSYIPKSL